MARTTFKGNPVTLSGNLPSVGSTAPNFVLTRTDLSDATLKDFSGKRIILNIFPSIDTPVCATSTRKFNTEVTKLGNTEVLCVSRDLPFAHGRFCGAEELHRVIPLSSLRNDDFGKSYGVRLMDGPLAGLFARAVVVLNESGKVIYTELVPDIAQEPNYQSALAAVG